MKIFQLFLSILIAQSAGIIGTVFTSSSIDSWYSTLNRPSFSPPNWVFGPVWITLYTLMGIAAYLVWRNRKNKQVKTALTFYAIQLVLNSLWSILFFGQQNPGLAFAEILILLFFIILTAVYFYKENAWAGILFLPYIAWVSFASILNYAIWQLN